MGRTTYLRKQHVLPGPQHSIVDGTFEDTTPDLADDAVGSQTADHLTCHQYVVLSATFQVPTFYFSVNDSSALPRRLPASLTS